MELLRFAGSEDDRCILETAKQFHAVIISNDQYREFPQYEKVARRRVGFRFKELPPVDVPQMHKDEHRWSFADIEFLINGKRDLDTRRFDSQSERMLTDFSDALCSSFHPHYEEVYEMYTQIHPDYFEERIEQCELMGGFFHMMHCLTTSRASLPHFDFYDSKQATPRTTFADFKRAYNRMQELTRSLAISSISPSY